MSGCDSKPKPRRGKKMAKFEYLVIDVLENSKGLFVFGGGFKDKQATTFAEAMNLFGEHGWELVQHERLAELDTQGRMTGGTVHYFYYKRVIV